MTEQYDSSKICKVEGCERASYKTGLCNMHYQRQRTYGDVGSAEPLAVRQNGICLANKIDGCKRKAVTKGYCDKHYNRLRLYGKLTIKIRERGSGTFQFGYHIVTKDKTQIAAHRIIAEKALGRKLLSTEVVHHVNGDKADNRPENLVICDLAYHNLLHQRADALEACGNANWRKCWICKQYDAPENLYIKPNGGPVRHRSCVVEYRRIAKAKRVCVTL
jgi:hypothetical protein